MKGIDIQEIINNAMKAKRADDMLTSSQLTLGELILKLEAIDDKTLPVIFDDKKYYPTGVESWRGSYRELAINFSTNSCQMTTKGFLALLKHTIGKEFMGYKGGMFLMGKTTPVWVANYGDSAGFRTEGDKYCQTVIDVIKEKENTVIKTKVIDY